MKKEIYSLFLMFCLLFSNYAKTDSLSENYNFHINLNYSKLINYFKTMYLPCSNIKFTSCKNASSKTAINTTKIAKFGENEIYVDEAKMPAENNQNQNEFGKILSTFITKHQNKFLTAIEKEPNSYEKQLQKLLDEERSKYETKLMKAIEKERENYQNELNKILESQNKKLKDVVEKTKSDIYKNEINKIREDEISRLTEELTESLTIKIKENLTTSLEAEYEKKKNDELFIIRKDLSEQILHNTKADTERIKILSICITLVSIAALLTIFITRKMKLNNIYRIEKKKLDVEIENKNNKKAIYADMYLTEINKSQPIKYLLSEIENINDKDEKEIKTQALYEAIKTISIYRSENFIEILQDEWK